jgi:hypothetical protein
VTFTLPLNVGATEHVDCEPVHTPVQDHAVGVKLQLTENVCEAPNWMVGFDGLMLHDALPAATFFDAVPPAAPVTVIVFAWLRRHVEPLELSQPVQPAIESDAPEAVRQLPVYVD